MRTLEDLSMSCLGHPLEVLAGPGLGIRRSVVSLRILLQIDPLVVSPTCSTLGAGLGVSKSILFV